MQVNTEQCNGCGACIEACPSDAIHMSAGLAILDQAVCAQCQACVDACPQGAITTTEISVVAATPLVVQPVSKSEIMVAEPVPSKLKPWLTSALAFTGREILPRLADTLIATLERRLGQTQPANSQACRPSQNAELLSRQNGGRGHRHRGRPGQARIHGRGQGHGNGKKIGR